MILHTKVIGEGDPMVFLHTGLETSETDFRYQVEYFSKTYRVISPDLRGHGKSGGHISDTYFCDAAKDLQETLLHLGVKQVHLAGCSLGAIVAIKFAQLFPELVKTLTVSGMMVIKPANWLELHESDVKFQAKLLENKDAILYYNQLHASDWKQFIYFGRQEDWYPFEDMKAITHFQFPVLILVGERNPWETAAVEYYPRNNAFVHVAVIPFAAHLVHSEQPEMYCLLVDQFINNTTNLEENSIRVEVES